MILPINKVKIKVKLIYKTGTDFLLKVNNMNKVTYEQFFSLVNHYSYFRDCMPLAPADKNRVNKIKSFENTKRMRLIYVMHSLLSLILKC